MPVIQDETPCWYARCDNCGEGDGYDAVDGYHYGSLEELVSALRDYDWHVVIHEDGHVCRVYCEPCWDEMGQTEQAENGACP